MRRNTKGFSLLEVLVVIAIVGILAAAGLPSLSNMLRNNRIQNQTKRLYSDLLNARLKADLRNMVHYVVFQGSGYQVIADRNENFVQDAPGATVNDDELVLARSNVDTVPFTFSNVVPQAEALKYDSITGGVITINSQGRMDPQGTVCVGHMNLVSQPSCNCVIVNPTSVRLGRIKTGDPCNADKCLEIN